MTTALTISQDFRAHLLAHESATHHVLEYVHAHMLASITPHLSLLYHQLQEQHAANPEAHIPLTWLHEHNRLDSLLSVVGYHVASFASAAATHITPLLHTASQLGKQNAAAQVQAVSNAPVKQTSPQEVSQRVSAATGQAQSLLSTFAENTARAVKTALIVGLTLGMTMAAIAKRVAKMLDRPRWWSESIAVTISWSCYREVQQDVFVANDLQEWIWRAHPGACKFCQGMDGTRHPVGEAMETHNNCRCDQIAA